MGSGKCRNRCIVSSGRSRNRSLHQFKYCFEHDVKLLVVLSGRMGPLSGKFYIISTSLREDAKGDREEWASALEKKKVQESITVTARPKATGR